MNTYILFVSPDCVIQLLRLFPDAKLDCDTILDSEVTHTKARTRKLRILESLSRYTEALQEVCALQLKFMQDNRESLRLGIPVTPPIPQSKVEDLMAKILPGVIDEQLAKIKERFGESDRPLPSNHTILQLLQSFTGYNNWMSAAARDGSLDSLTTKINALPEGKEGSAEKVELLLKRGRRHAYHRKFENCKVDVEEAYEILEKEDGVKDLLEGKDIHGKLLEWVGMCRHLGYDLDGAAKCYEACSDLEPTNVSFVVVPIKYHFLFFSTCCGLFN